MSERRERIRWLIAGVGLGVLALTLIIAGIACASMGANSGAGGWAMLQAGTTVIQTPCGIVAIEVRAVEGVDRTTYYWRIVVIPKTQTIKPRPPKGKLET